MDLARTAWSWREAFGVVAFRKNPMVSPQNQKLSSPIRSYPFPHIPSTSCVVHSKRRSSLSESVSKPTFVDEESVDDEDDLLFDEFEDEGLVEDEYSAEDAKQYVGNGDGEGGGGISLAGSAWDKEALAIAEEVALSFDGDLKIYAFRTLRQSTIRVRIEKLSNKSGSPSMADIEAFSIAYRKRLNDAELSGSIPENLCIEVSSPGVERVVRVPEELDRFKDRPMYVKYASEVAATDSSTEKDGVFRLVSFDMETKCCVWGLADVKVNRGKAGKGRPLSKKQREWRLNTPFDSLRLVRFHSDI